MQQTELTMPVQRFFGPGEPVRVVVGGNFGFNDRTVKVLMRHLSSGGIEVLDVREIRAPRLPEHKPALIQLSSVQPEKRSEPYGPQRKGPGGKVRRW